MPSQQVPKSRYVNAKIKTAELSDGKVIDVLERRLIPEPADPQSPESTWVEIARQERLDSVADRLWQNPPDYWRLMDATTCMEVSELEEVKVDAKVQVEPSRLLLPEES